MRFNVIISDLDGTIYLDGKPIGNIVENINDFTVRGGKVFYLTNNTSVNKIAYVNKLKDLNFDAVSEDSVITPIDVFIHEMQQESNQIKSCYYVLPHEVIRYIEMNGGPKHDQTKPDLILVGFDTELDYNKLKHTCNLINKNIPYHITHNDKFCPSINGPIPDAGSIANLLYSTTGVKYSQNYGKPDAKMVNYIRMLLAGSDNLANAVMIGDRLSTDIKLGENIGIDTCQVKTGDRTIAADAPVPKYEFENINDFFDSLINNK